MKTLSLYLIILSVVFSILFCSGCVDSLEPAGPAEYVNPDYPSDLFGYASISSQFAGAFYYLDRVYILDRLSQAVISFSASDPNLADPDSLVHKDTLQLGIPPGISCFDESSSSLIISHDVSNDIYILDPSSSEPPRLFYETESVITSIFPVENGASIIVCFLGPEWLVRKINTTTGAVENEFSTGWPITRAAISVDETRLLLSNSGRKYLIEIDADSFEKLDSIPMPERVGPFLYNTSGNIVVFNQYTIHPRVFLLHGQNKSILNVLETINPYKYCSLMPGTDVVLAPRKSDNRVSVLNTDNMVFAPSIFCFTYADIAFSSPSNQWIFVFCKSLRRAYVFENEL